MDYGMNMDLVLNPSGPTGQVALITNTKKCLVNIIIAINPSYIYIPVKLPPHVLSRTIDILSPLAN